ncbi:TlpA disulfide reductase family protein [Chryseobacterium sp. ES2]|uniref:TlpA disulfide reductase family protein n=1 Tax=Chryseobacterium metallicongregator TaxID=3073042 RepID=A0ABU1E035_9FLAO|nr:MULTISPECIES: TlpA disulfide reductase family protein [Chryseobacterium]MDR4950980.1 TlpA disulfide reductase family protein [Chryseobacterium sp. ES2]
MKRWFLFFIIPMGIILIGLLFLRSKNTNSLTQQHKSPDIKNSPFHKEYLSKGGITVVNVWATWCQPCVEEIPAFQKIATENNHIKFVFLSLDEDQKKLEMFLTKHPINDITFKNKDYIETIKTFLGGNGVMGYSVIPQTFIIKDGKVVDKSMGGIDYQNFTDKLKSFY